MSVRSYIARAVIKEAIKSSAEGAMIREEDGEEVEEVVPLEWAVVEAEPVTPVVDLAAVVAPVVVVPLTWVPVVPLTWAPVVPLVTTPLVVPFKVPMWIFPVEVLLMTPVPPVAIPVAIPVASPVVVWPETEPVVPTTGVE